MAIGKESMERAAKAVGKKGQAAQTDNAERTSGRIVYQTSSQVMERAAKPNEIFGIGDAMPVYYL